MSETYNKILQVNCMQHNTVVFVPHRMGSMSVLQQRAGSLALVAHLKQTNQHVL